MARVFLLSATPADDRSELNLTRLRDLQRCAAVDRFKVHSVTSDPAAADLIVFAEFYGAGWYLGRVRRHPLVNKYRDKSFVFCTNPFVIPFLPGVYAGVEKRWSSSRTRGGFYLEQGGNEFTTYTPPAADLPYLFSFMGSIKTARVRRDLATLVHPRSFFQDTAEDFDRVLHGKMDRRERMDYHRRFAELIKGSKFVLCPRGLSATSVRLYETMRMGRVPVILSDGWVPPPGPRWDKFVVRIAERNFARIPRILERWELASVEMGELARQEWEEWFSDEVLFHRVVELCLDIRNSRSIPESVGRWIPHLQWLRPYHVRRSLGAGYRSLRGAFRRASR